MTVETIGRIRREFFVKGKTIKEIARDLRLSRNTVRKVVRSQATSFEYERTVQPRPRLGAWTATLDGLLMENALKPTRERLTVIRIFEALRDLGYEGGYDAVRRYAKRWRGRQVSGTVDAHVPLIFAPGEAYQFDWSHEIVVLNGTTTLLLTSMTESTVRSAESACNGSRPGLSLWVKKDGIQATYPSAIPADARTRARRCSRCTARAHRVWAAITKTPV